MAAAFWDSLLLVTASFATTSLQNDLNAVNAANPASQELVERDLVSRDDNEEDERTSSSDLAGIHPARHVALRVSLAHHGLGSIDVQGLSNHHTGPAIVAISGHVSNRAVAKWKVSRLSNVASSRAVTLRESAKGPSVDPPQPVRAAARQKRPGCTRVVLLPD
jgi:hypothetical protein